MEPKYLAPTGILIVTLLTNFSFMINVFAIDREPMVQIDTKIASVTTFDAELLESLPIQRNMNGLLELTPGFNQQSFHGSSAYNNIYYVDGVNMTNHLQTASTPNLNFDFIDEVQVKTGGYEAEYGNAMGGVINVITKSGGNEFHGSLSTWYTPESFSSNLPDGIRGDGYDYDKNFETSFSLGGPLIKDKLWFFTSGNIVSQSTHALFEDDVPLDYLNIYPQLNLTYQPNLQNKFFFSYHFARNTFDRNRSQFGYDFKESNIEPYQTLTGSWQKSFSSGWQTNLRTSYTQFNWNFDEKDRPQDPNAEHTTYFDFTKEKSAGTFDINLDVTPPDIRFCPIPHHTKFGLGFESTRYSKKLETTDSEIFSTIPYTEITENQNTINHKAHMTNWSFYVQDSWSMFDKLTLNVGLRYDKFIFSWPDQSGGENETDAETVYDWNCISPRVRMSYDIKGDGRNVIHSTFGRYYQPNQYDWFSEVNPMGNYGYLREQVIQNGTTVADDRFSYWDQPDIGIGYDKWDLKTPYIDEFTIGIERQLWEDWSLGIRYIKKWERNSIQTVDASALDMDALMDDGKRVWLNYGDQLITDPYNGNEWVVYDNLDPYRTHDYYLVNPPGAERNYDGVELTLNKRYSHGWFMNFSYVYSNAHGLISPWDYDQNYGMSNLYQNPNSHINANGRFQYSYPHQFKAYGMAEGPFGIKIGSSVFLVAGNAYTRSLAYGFPPLDTITDGFNTMNAEEPGSSRLPTFWWVNLRLSKTVPINDFMDATFYLDGYNITNNDTKLEVNSVSNNEFYEEGEIERILNPGLFQFGVRVSF